MTIYDHFKFVKLKILNIFNKIENQNIMGNVRREKIIFVLSYLIYDKPPWKRNHIMDGNLKGLVQFVATEKTDLKAYRCYFPSLYPSPPPSFGHSPPLAP